MPRWKKVDISQFIGKWVTTAEIAKKLNISMDQARYLLKKLRGSKTYIVKTSIILSDMRRRQYYITIRESKKSLKKR